jgi:acyl carrier protein
MSAKRNVLAIGLGAGLVFGVGSCGQKAEVAPAHGGAKRARSAEGAVKKHVGTVEERVRAIVKEQFGPGELAATDDFVKKGKADSLDCVELVMAVEEEFDLEISDPEAEKLRTIGDVVAFVEKKKAAVK